MPEFVADFHLHSRYSRATSKDLTVQELAKWAKLKGIGLMGTGDFTHPLWLQELKEALRGAGGGLYECDGVRFILTVEVNTLFYRRDRAHQIHHVLFAPSLEAVDRLNRELERFGSLVVDGRPTLRLDAPQFVEVVRGVEPRALIVPAHVWTPHFSLFGSNSGFNTVEACFGRQTEHIRVLETGLSSDPAMNWRLSALDRYALISNSDSHSARRIGREANRFDCALDYDEIIRALVTKDRSKFLGTVEFFPEEGKYHYDGHRACEVRWAPAETRTHEFRCSRCERRVTVGVMHRVEELADRPDGTVPDGAIPFHRSVPLEELIAEALEVGAGSQAVEREYLKLVHQCGTEFRALLQATEDELRRATTPKIAEGILRMRQGRVTVEPGYDGEYGKVRVFAGESSAADAQQLTLF